MTTYQINLSSAANRLDRSRPALSLLEELLAAWEVEFRACRFSAAKALWIKVEAARRAE